LLEIGQRREPFNMEFQMDLAETLLRAGETAAAQRVASRVVTLTPSYSRRALALLESFGIDPISAVTALGTTPPVLIAARDTFVEARLGDAFLTLAEAQLISAPHELIEAYGHVAFRQRAFERVIQALEPVETSAGPAAAVVQSRLLAEALLATGRVAEACERAQLAQGIDPGDPRVLEVLGDCLLASGRTADSVLSYRSALGIVVRGGASAGQMSRLYRKIGESYERAGEGDRAFDAYTKALELVPSDVLASMRLAFLTQNRGGGLRAR
jgi:tetratricopeptide (TPR) repeat protein